MKDFQQKILIFLNLLNDEEATDLVVVVIETQIEALLPKSSTKVRSIYFDVVVLQTSVTFILVFE